MLIAAPARIHVTLLDTTGVSARVPGGVGFALAEPATRIRILNSPFASLRDLGDLDERDTNEIGAVLSAIQQLAARPNPKIICEARSLPHHGYGSKTSLLSAIAFGLRAYHQLDMTDDEIQLITKRGGTSGVGYYAFRYGGLVWDAGQPNAGEPVVPSSKRLPKEAPLLMARWEVPEHGILMLRPRVSPLNHSAEISFMENSRNFPVGELAELCLAVFQGFLPAFVASDFDTMRESLNLISKLGLKRREIDCYGGAVENLRKHILQTFGFPCGMSSLGPSIYCIFNPAKVDVHDVAAHLLKLDTISTVTHTSVTNSGCRIVA